MKLPVQKSSSLDNVKFNYDDLLLVSIPESSVNTIVANQEDYDECNTINYGIGFFEEDNEIKSALIVKTEILSENIKQIDYFNTDNELLMSIELDAENETSAIIYQKEGANLKSANSTGQDVMDCVTDIYSNKGWVSVWTWVQTAFIPATAVAAVAACIGANM